MNPLTTTQAEALDLLAARPDRGCGVSTTNWQGVSIRPGEIAGDSLVARSAADALVRRGLAVGPITVRMSVRYYVTPDGLHFADVPVDETNDVPGSCRTCGGRLIAGAHRDSSSCVR